MYSHVLWACVVGCGTTLAIANFAKHHASAVKTGPEVVTGLTPVSSADVIKLVSPYLPQSIDSLSEADSRHLSRWTGRPRLVFEFLLPTILDDRDPSHFWTKEAKAWEEAVAYNKHRISLVRCSNCDRLLSMLACRR